MTTTADQAKMVSFAVSSRFRRRLRGLTSIFSPGLRFDGRASQRLLIAPHDLRTADATIANDIYRGRLSLAGSVANIGTTSPFLLPPPSTAWQEDLLSFAWLRHLHAADDPVSRVHARALIGDWIAIQGKGHPVAWKPEVMARRIISWLCHSPLYLEHADPAYYQAVMKSLGRQLRHLSRHSRDAEDGLPRLTAYIALAYATLCISGLERLQARVGRILANELSRQVLPDGGHVSRHPGAILDLLLDLLPLRQTYLSRDIVPPRELIGAIDRMLPMVRFFRHGDGDFALFNGMGRTPIGAVSSVLAYDDTLGRHAEQAPHSGYQRLDGGSTLVLFDTGAPPPASVSSKAHAGCLSFELSSGRQRIITNCGTSPALRDEWRRAARTTAAHSTVSVENASSVKFVGSSKGESELGAPIAGGPKSVTVKRSEVERGQMVEARHDGYRSLGIIHTRQIRLSKDGLDVEGQDKLTRSSTMFSRTRGYAIRYHLHPSVEAQIDRDGRSVVLTTPGDERWVFSVVGATPRLDESVYLADPKGARSSTQIVVAGQCGTEAVIKWAFARDVGQGVRRVRSAREGEREEGIMPAAYGPMAEDDTDEEAQEKVEAREKKTDAQTKSAEPSARTHGASREIPETAPDAAGAEPNKSPAVPKATTPGPRNSPATGASPAGSTASEKTAPSPPRRTSGLNIQPSEPVRGGRPGAPSRPREAGQQPPAARPNAEAAGPEKKGVLSRWLSRTPAEPEANDPGAGAAPETPPRRDAASGVSGAKPEQATATPARRPLLPDRQVKPRGPDDKPKTPGSTTPSGARSLATPTVRKPDAAPPAPQGTAPANKTPASSDAKPPGPASAEPAPQKAPATAAPAQKPDLAPARPGSGTNTGQTTPEGEAKPEPSHKPEPRLTGFPDIRPGNSRSGSSEGNDDGNGGDDDGGGGDDKR